MLKIYESDLNNDSEDGLEHAFYAEEMRRIFDWDLKVNLYKSDKAAYRDAATYRVVRISTCEDLGTAESVRPFRGIPMRAEEPGGASGLVAIRGSVWAYELFYSGASGVIFRMSKLGKYAKDGSMTVITQYAYNLN